MAGPRRLTRPVTVVAAEPGGPEAGNETARTLRAVLLGVAASLVALLLLGHAVSRTTVFLAVQRYADQARPFAAERGGTPRLAAVPSSLLVGRSRAYVRVDAEWEEGGADDPLEFFLERTYGEGEGAARGSGERGGRVWRVIEARIGEPVFLRSYALNASDSEIPAPSR